LRFRGEVYHGYHFNCTSCGIELDSSAREIKSRTGFAANDMVRIIQFALNLKLIKIKFLSLSVFFRQNELYCLKCHDRMGVSFIRLI
jgi:hypothetical protein